MCVTTKNRTFIKDLGVTKKSQVAIGTKTGSDGSRCRARPPTFHSTVHLCVSWNDGRCLESPTQRSSETVDDMETERERRRIIKGPSGDFGYRFG